MTWRDTPGGDPIPWLLKKENPAITYQVFRDLLDAPDDDPDVRAAQVAIAGWPRVARLLTTQKRAGYWISRDFYLPKYDGTFWTLTLLADLGLTRDVEQIERACEFMFSFQRENGAFCRRRRVAGRGLVWADDPGPCTQARIVRFLIQFGYGDDSRTQAGMAWLLATPRADGMWDCGRPDRPGCLRATLDVLRAAILHPVAKGHPVVRRGAETVCGLLMKPRMDRYHVGHDWEVLEYPCFDYCLTAALQSLAHLGYTTAHPHIAAAHHYLLSRQAADGTWPLDRERDRLPLKVGAAGAPNVWVTLEALRAIKLLHQE